MSRTSISIVFNSLLPGLFVVKGFDSIYDHRLLIFRQFRIDGESQHFLRGLLRNGEVPSTIFEKGVTFLQMEGNGIIDVRANPFLGQELPQTVSFGDTDHILMKDMAALILYGRELKTLHRREKVLELLLIPFSLPLSLRSPFFQVFEFHQKNGRLNRVETAVDPNRLMEIFRLTSMDSQQSDLLCQKGMIRHDHSRISEGTQVLRRIKGKTSEVAYLPGSPSFQSSFGLILCPQCLGSIFNDKKFLFLGDLKKRVHISALSEEMDREDGLCSRCDLLFDFGRVHVIGLPVDIRKDGDGSEARDRSCGCEESEGRQKDLIARPDATSHQGQEQGI